MGIRARASALFLVLGVAPLAVSYGLLLPSYGQEVRESEEQLQLATLVEVSRLVEHRWDGVRHDAYAIATAVAHAAQVEDADASEAVIRAALIASPWIEAVRFEVPAARVDTTLTQEGAATDDVPSSTAAQRKEAKSVTVSYAPVDDVRSSLVVSVPDVRPDGAPSAAAGWITVPLYLKPFTALAEEALHRRSFGDETRLIVVDDERRVLASVGAGLPARGESAATLSIWRSLPSEVGPREQLDLKNEFTSDGVPMVGALHVLPEPGWTVAMWRPESVAMVGYAQARKTAMAIGAGALLLALILGLWASRTVTQPVLALVEAAKRIGQRRWDELPPPRPRSDELGTLGVTIHAMAKELQMGEAELAKEVRLRTDLSRFMSQEVVEGIVAGSLSLELGGERRPVTVLFADMVAFTAAAENAAPEEVVAMLNELFSVLTEVVFRHGGTVDKFIGDCLMAIWGAPVGDEDHALHALEAAEDMMRFLEAGRGQWREDFGVEMRLAIGINSGDAIVGNVGSRERMEYTVIGDVVNVAARLETIAAPDQVLLSAKTLHAAGEGFEVRRLGERKLTGRSEGVEIYELVAL